MKLLFTGDRETQRNSLYKLLFRALSGGFTPILLTGDRSFDLYDFLRVRKKMRFPMELASKIQFACAVNAHHLKTLISRTKDFDLETSFPIFLDFTGHYLDDTISEDIRTYMFYRDLKSLSSVESIKTPIFFFESGFLYRDTIHSKLKNILENKVKIHLEQSKDKTRIRRFFLNESEKKEFFEGSPHSGLFYLCKKLSTTLRNTAKISYSQ
jgi:hypothetical protein